MVIGERALRALTLSTVAIVAAVGLLLFPAVVHVFRFQDIAHVAVAAYLVLLHGSMVLRRRVEGRRQHDLLTVLSLVMDNLPAAVFMADEHRTLVYAGGRALTDAGYDPASLVGLKVEAVVDDPNVVRLYDEALAGRPAFVVHRLHGVRYYTQAVPIPEPVRVAGGSACILVTSIDLTATMHLSSQVENAIRQLSEHADRRPLLATG